MYNGLIMKYIIDTIFIFVCLIQNAIACGTPHFELSEKIEKIEIRFEGSVIKQINNQEDLGKIIKEIKITLLQGEWTVPKYGLLSPKIRIEMNSKINRFKGSVGIGVGFVEFQKNGHFWQNKINKDSLEKILPLLCLSDEDDEKVKESLFRGPWRNVP